MTEKDKKRILTRQERDLFSEDAKVHAYPQMEQISAFLVECYDGSKWVKSWDTAINGALPKSVRVTVQFEEEGKPAQFTVLSLPRVSGS
jgi:general secretion pathway protein J